MKNVIGCWNICNNASLNLYDINYDMDTCVVGINNFETEEFEIQIEYNEDTEDTEMFIEYGEIKFYLSECLRVNEKSL